MRSMEGPDPPLNMTATKSVFPVIIFLRLPPTGVWSIFCVFVFVFVCSAALWNPGIPQTSYLWLFVVFVFVFVFRLLVFSSDFLIIFLLTALWLPRLSFGLLRTLFRLLAVFFFKKNASSCTLYSPLSSSSSLLLLLLLMLLLLLSPGILLVCSSILMGCFTFQTRLFICLHVFALICCSYTSARSRESKLVFSLRKWGYSYRS